MYQGSGLIVVTIHEKGLGEALLVVEWSSAWVFGRVCGMFWVGFIQVSGRRVCFD